MTTIVDKIRKRIRTRQMLEEKIIEEIQITTKESEQLGNTKMIDGVKLIIVNKLNDKAKEDCFAYINRAGHRSCYCLDKLYCVNASCSFYKKCNYNTDCNIPAIERSINKYIKEKEI